MADATPQKIHDALWKNGLCGEGYKFAMVFDESKDEYEEPPKETELYFLDDLLEEVVEYMGADKVRKLLDEKYKRRERIMRKYTVKFPRGIEVDIFNLPEDFEEQIKESFRGYTDETAKEYRYCDKLGYIDRCIEYLNGGKHSDDIVNEMVEGRILYEWRENGEIIQEDDVYCFEFMNECYDRGNKDASLYSHFGNDDHHIFDQIQKVLVKVITIVMNYED